jgi:hypothetical protein
MDSKEVRKRAMTYAAWSEASMKIERTISKASNPAVEAALGAMASFAATVAVGALDGLNYRDVMIQFAAEGDDKPIKSDAKPDLRVVDGGGDV